jgi:hypothetical protein
MRSAEMMPENVTDNVRHEPMSARDRQRKHRARLKAAMAALTPEQRFRLALWRFVDSYIPPVDLRTITLALDQLAEALEMAAYCKTKRASRDPEKIWTRNHVWRYLATDPSDWEYHGVAGSKREE